MGVATGDMGIAKDGTPQGRVPARHGAARQVHAVRRGLPRLAVADADVEVQPARRRRSAELRPRHQGDLGGRRPRSTSAGWSIHSQGWPLDQRRRAAARSSTISATTWSRSASWSHLGYENPYVSPFEEIQRFKTHPAIRGTSRAASGSATPPARSTRAGCSRCPGSPFPGGALIGCTAGFVNLPRIKGITQRDEDRHAGRRGRVRGDWRGRSQRELVAYPEAFRKSWVYKDLYKVRNVKPGLEWGCGWAPSTVVCTCGSTTSASAAWSAGRCGTARPDHERAEARGEDAAHRLPEA